LKELRNEAIAGLESRGYDVRGKTPAQIRMMLRARPSKRLHAEMDLAVFCLYEMSGQSRERGDVRFVPISETSVQHHSNANEPLAPTQVRPYEITRMLSIFEHRSPIVVKHTAGCRHHLINPPIV
jgi:hypothetical protein